MFENNDAESVNLVKELLDLNHIDINAVDTDGRTALWYATNHEHPEIMELSISQ